MIKIDFAYVSIGTIFPKVRNAKEVWITEAILTEVGNALSASTRNEAVRFINQCYQTDNIRVVTINTVLFRQALSLYNSRPDKNWGLTDCISFIVMTMPPNTRLSHTHPQLKSRMLPICGSKRRWSVRTIMTLVRPAGQSQICPI